MTGDLFGARDEWHCALLDPPWAERGGGKIKRGADRHYGLVGKLGDVEPIRRVILDSGAWTPAANAHAWCWYTDNFLEDALELMRGLGFRYVRTFQWIKVRVDDDGRAIVGADGMPIVRYGIGQYGRGAHEGLLFCVRGSGQDESVWTGARDVPSVFHAPNPVGEDGKRIHSRKPDASYDVVERVSRGPRIEFFARVARVARDGEKWRVWGNQAPEVAP